MKPLSISEIEMVSGGYVREIPSAFERANGIESKFKFKGKTGSDTYKDALDDAQKEAQELLGQGVDPRDAIADGLALAGF